MLLVCTLCNDRSMTFDIYYIVYILYKYLNMKNVYIPVTSKKPWQHEISTPMSSINCIIVPCYMCMHHRPWQQRHSNILHQACSIKTSILAPPPFLNAKWSHDSHVTHFAMLIFTYLWHISLHISILLSKDVIFTFYMY